MYVYYYIYLQQVCYTSVQKHFSICEHLFTAF